MLYGDMDIAASTCRHATWLQMLHGYMVTWPCLITNTLVPPTRGLADLKGTVGDALRRSEGSFEEAVEQPNLSRKQWISGETSLPAQVASAVALQLIPWRAIQRFESETYCQGYIDFHVGDEVVPLPTPPGEDDAQWMYGRNGTHTGWFPAKFVEESLESFR